MLVRQCPTLQHALFRFIQQKCVTASPVFVFRWLVPEDEPVGEVLAEMAGV